MTEVSGRMLPITPLRLVLGTDTLSPTEVGALSVMVRTSPKWRVVFPLLPDTGVEATILAVRRVYNRRLKVHIYMLDLTSVM